MKKVFVVLCIAMMLSGCGAQIPDMTEEQSKEIAEYAAGLLMKYDTQHESRLLNDAELEEELARLEALAKRKAELAAMDEELKEAKQKEKEEKEQALAETPVISQGETGPSGQYVEDFYGIDGIAIRYQGYDVMDVYPESEEEHYFRMQATNGKKLLVINFIAKNETGADLSLDMISIAPSFKVGINGEAARPALSTLLMDDLANYRGTLAAGEEVSLVIMTEIAEENAGNIDYVSVIMKNDSNSATILMN